MTPHQYYLHIKVHKAESLLEQNMPVKEAAWALGFDGQYYFSRLFKNEPPRPKGRRRRTAAAQSVKPIAADSGT